MASEPGSARRWKWVGSAARSLAIAAVVVAVWELFELLMGASDAQPIPFLWQSLLVVGLAVWFVLRSTQPKNTALRQRWESGTWWQRTDVLAERVGSVLAIVAGWNLLGLLLTLDWGAGSTGQEAELSRLMFWTVLLIVGSGLTRPWGADALARAGRAPDHPTG